jgi:branched-chain amino acid transport system ATP-binding protein
MLELHDLDVHYGKQAVLHAVSLRAAPGEVVALIGPNAAGKSTTLRTAIGLKQPSAGGVRLGGHDLERLPVRQRLQRGLVLVPEGRQVFPRLSVRDNLLMGAYHRRDREHFAADLTDVFALFPRLQERAAQKAGSMSGGEQPMLAIGRGLMSRPSAMLLDEPTLGLAPIVVDELGRALRVLAGRGMAIVLAEQNATMALGCADRAYVLESGRIALQGPAAELADTPRVREMYLGH